MCLPNVFFIIKIVLTIWDYLKPSEFMDEIFLFCKKKKAAGIFDTDYFKSLDSLG